MEGFEPEEYRNLDRVSREPRVRELRLLSKRRRRHVGQFQAFAEVTARRPWILNTDLPDPRSVLSIGQVAAVGFLLSVAGLALLVWAIAADLLAPAVVSYILLLSGVLTMSVTSLRAAAKRSR